MNNSPKLSEEFWRLSRLFAYPDDLPSAVDLAWPAPGGGSLSTGALDLTQLQADYVRLFINALPEVPCPPYGSYYLEGRLMGASTIKLRDLYLSYGFEVDEPADHIAVELEFLAWLLDQPSGPEIERDADFILSHLRSWTPEFLERLETQESPDLYKSLARMARTVIISQ